MRVTNGPLADGDQISIGDHDLIFRLSEAPDASSARSTLLRTCSLLFLFRALAGAGRSPEAGILEQQLVRLIGDFIHFEDGHVLLGKESELREYAAERRFDFAALIDRVALEGLISDTEQGLAAVPVYARGQLSGVILGRVGPANAAEAAELLSAIAVLAASAIENVRETQALRNQNTLLIEQLGEMPTGLVGDSKPMQRIRETITRVAPRDTTILILGESGTGKELIARALHRQSNRAAAPFVAVNCASLTENLLESELFGHEKGAFTGALALKKGKLELAEGGTVFLDEIGELAPGLQARLLRVLQEREFERVGGTRVYRLDIRVIAATNRDLAAEARKGVFREDLYHRLNVIALRTAPLRERPEDILPLACYFLKRSAARCARRVESFSPASERLLEAYSWPGNVRELENAVEHAVVLGVTDSVLPEDLPEHVLYASPAAAASPQSFQGSVGNARRDSIIRAWEQAGGDYKAAAAILEVHPNSLLRLIRNLGLRDMLRQP